MHQTTSSHTTGTNDLKCWSGSAGVGAQQLRSLVVKFKFSVWAERSSHQQPRSVQQHSNQGCSLHRGCPFRQHLSCRAYTRTDGKASLPDIAPILDTVQQQDGSSHSAHLHYPPVEDVDSASLFPESHVSIKSLSQLLGLAFYFPFGGCA